MKGKGLLTLFIFLLSFSYIASTALAWGCYDDWDCPSGYYCSGYSCVYGSNSYNPGCYDDWDCPWGYYCSSYGTCIYGSGTANRCYDSWDCPSGYYCSGGSCIYSGTGTYSWCGSYYDYCGSGCQYPCQQPCTGGCPTQCSTTVTVSTSPQNVCGGQTITISGRVSCTQYYYNYDPPVYLYLDGGSIGTVNTDSNGYYTYTYTLSNSLSSSTHTIRADSTFNNCAQGTASTTFYTSSCAQQGTLKIKVSDCSTGSAITNARVELFGPQNPTQYTDSNGYVIYQDIRTGTYSFTASASSYSSKTVSTTVYANQNNYENICLTKTQACTERYLDDYRCSGDWRQRLYQYSDCRTEWRNYDHDGNCGCTGSSCGCTSSSCGTCASTSCGCTGPCASATVTPVYIMPEKVKEVEVARTPVTSPYEGEIPKVQVVAQTTTSGTNEGIIILLIILIFFFFLLFAIIIIALLMRGSNGSRRDYTYVEKSKEKKSGVDFSFFGSKNKRKDSPECFERIEKSRHNPE